MSRELVFIFMLASVGILTSGKSSKLEVLNGSPYVTLKHGLYFGKTITSGSRKQEKYYAFLGIRYSTTPGRFERSIVMSDLDTVPLPLLAQSLGSSCPQISHDGMRVIGKEDCLFGNIYIPRRDPADEDGFPVIVFIHPGSFKSGSGGAFNVEYFMRQNVICATFNYRIGALGFLSTEDATMPDNLGLRDIHTYLHWIRDNIESFGGNKKRITIAGIESGAASVQHLLLSQHSKGLFQGAIIHGTSLFSTFSTQSSPLTSAVIRQQFSDELECPLRPTQLFVECIKIKRLKDVMQAQQSILEKYLNLSSPFLPGYEKCTKPSSSCSDLFFSSSPAWLLAERVYKRVPLLIGMNSAETLRSNYYAGGVHSSTKIEMEEETFTTWLLEILKQIPGFKHEEFITNSYKEIQQLYFNGSTTPRNNGKLMVYDSLKRFLYDAFVVYEVWKFALTYARDKPVYPYVISFQGNRTASSKSIFYDEYDGSNPRIYEEFPDGIEFLTPSLPHYHEFEADSDEEVFSRNLVHLWATFAVHQKPVDVWTSRETWLPLSAAQLNGEKPITWYALKSKEINLIPEPFTTRMKFWNRLFK